MKYSSVILPMGLKKLNDKTQYEVVPSYSVLIVQGLNTVFISAEEIARLHMESSVAPDQTEQDQCHAGTPDSTN